MSTSLLHLTRGNVRTAADNGAIAVIPIGAVEQHGEHLPLGTDTLLVDAVIHGALASVETAGEGDGDTAGARWLVLPTLAFGHSPHHLFSAAVSLAPATLSAVLSDVLDSLTTTGFRRMVIVNGHGGNDEIMRLAVKAHALRANVSVGACSYWTLASDTAESSMTERPENTPGHAGWFETSLMLAAHGSLVQPERSYQRSEPPALFEQSPVATLTVERYGEWARVGGVTDDPAEASAEAGGQLLRRRIAGLARALAAFDDATRDSHGGRNDR